MGLQVAINKKAFRNYAFFERIECGIALTGGEVKSLRLKEVNFADSFARLEGQEVLLYHLHIAPYAQASYLNEDPDRVRKLLLHKNEIEKISGQVAQKKFALIPTKIYFNARGLAKVELGLGKGKKLYDKRDDIKRRDVDRQLKRLGH